MIPKKIHYVWFGGPKPDKILRCIETWHKHLPDWDLVEWNESDFNFNKFPKLMQRYIVKKRWGYVSDYARFTLLLDNPGVYLDTDMFLVRSIPDEMLKSSFFSCIESTGFVAPGVFGVSEDESVRAMLRKLLGFYEISKSINMSPQVVTPILREVYNAQDLDFERETTYDLSYNAKIYGCEYFYPLHWSTGRLSKYRPCLSDRTVGIHEWNFDALNQSSNFESNYRSLIDQYLKETDLI